MPRDLHFCSISLISSGGIFILSICSCKTLAHFCKDSITVQGLDISATKTTTVSCRDSAETANFNSPLWYKSPSRIQTLQRVWSERKRHRCTQPMPTFCSASLQIEESIKCYKEDQSPATTGSCPFIFKSGACVNDADAFIQQDFSLDSASFCLKKLILLFGFYKGQPTQQFLDAA